MKTKVQAVLNGNIKNRIQQGLLIIALLTL
jgi:hypothetical protein